MRIEPGDLMRFFLTFLFVFLTVSPIHAQVSVTSTYTLIPVRGTVVGVSNRGIVMEVDGKTGPVPMNRETDLRIYATGDPGFVQKGSVVTVSGAIIGKGTLGNADITVHLNPRQTARQQTRVFRDTDSEMTMTGVVLSTNPLVINGTDLLDKKVGNAGSNVGILLPPISPGKILVHPSARTKESVSLVLGSALGMISPNDDITYYFRQDRPDIARSVNVTKKEPLQSPAAKAKDAQETKKGNKDSNG